MDHILHARTTSLLNIAYECSLLCTTNCSLITFAMGSRKQQAHISVAPRLCGSQDFVRIDVRTKQWQANRSLAGHATHYPPASASMCRDSPQKPCNVWFIRREYYVEGQQASNLQPFKAPCNQAGNNSTACTLLSRQQNSAQQIKELKAYHQEQPCLHLKNGVQ